MGGYTWNQNDFATGLENRMATFLPPTGYAGQSIYGAGTPFKARCWLLKNTDSANSATRSATQTYLQFAVGATTTNHMIQHPATWEIYTMKAGVQPFEGAATDTSGAILASQTVWPGMNSI